MENPPANKPTPASPHAPAPRVDPLLVPTLVPTGRSIPAVPPRSGSTGTLREVAPGVRIGEDALVLQYSRGSGPGGQNVNKLNTKAELWVPLAALVGLTEAARRRLAHLAGRRLTQEHALHLSSDVHRTQKANRDDVFDRLRELLLTAMVEPKHRRKTKPTRASKRRRLEGKRQRGEVKALRRRSED